MRKRVIILGVGNAQVDAISYCKERGYEVYGVSYRREGAGLELVDHFDLINITDKQGVLKYARDIGADIAYSVGSDVAMPTVGFVSEKLGLPCFVGEKTAEMMQYKGSLRRFLKRNQLCSIPFRVVANLDQALEWKIFPAIIKPVDSQGQRGVFEVNDRKDIERYFERALSFSHSKNVIIERYVKGSEISVNSFALNGTVIYNFITDRLVVEGVPGGIVKGHRIPADIPKWAAQKADDLSRAVIEKLGIRNGPVYFQLKYDDNDVYLIEATPRLDGCHLWRLIDLYYGVNLLDISFRLLQGEDMPKPVQISSLSKNGEKALLLDFFLQKPRSTFKKIADEKSDVLYRKWYYQEGDMIQPVNEQLERTGFQIRREL